MFHIYNRIAFLLQVENASIVYNMRFLLSVKQEISNTIAQQNCNIMSPRKKEHTEVRNLIEVKKDTNKMKRQRSTLREKRAKSGKWRDFSK